MDDPPNRRRLGFIEDRPGTNDHRAGLLSATGRTRVNVLIEPLALGDPAKQLGWGSIQSAAKPKERLERNVMIAALDSAYDVWIEVVLS